MDLRRTALGAILVTLTVPAVASPGRAQDLADVQIQTLDVAPGVYMLVGAGGNIGVSAGRDGVFLIDDQYAPLTEKILAAVRTVSEAPVRFVLNTHWHNDHTGGNENLGEAGALIVAHDNVRARMSVEQFLEAFDRRYPPAPESALPVVTFSEAVTFHLNGDEIHAFHVVDAHTDGDAIIHFRKANAVHMGDAYFNGLYPFIDVGSGGSIDGTIAAVDAVLALIDDETRVIPGHGPLSNKAELVAYRDMLAGVRERIAAEIAQGKTVDAVIAAQPTAAYDASWGKGFLNPENFTRIVYADLTRNKM